MTWARLDDDFPNHPKVVDLSDGAFRLHVTAICYAAKWNTRGEITPKAFRTIGGRAKYATELVAATVWDTTQPDGWAIHDFEVYNPPREPSSNAQLSRIRAEAGRRGGRASGETRRSKREANDEATLLQANEAPSRPVPSPTPTEPIGSSGVGVASPPDDPLPLAVTEVRDMVMAALPGKWQRDPLTWQEAEQFGRDFAGKQRETGEAIEAFRRTESGLPFPQKLRKFMPGGSQPAASPPKATLPPTLAELDAMYEKRLGRRPVDGGS